MYSVDYSSYYANIRNRFVIHLNVTKIVIIILVNKRVVRDPGIMHASIALHNVSS